MSTRRENQSIPKFLAPGGKTVVTPFKCLSLRGVLIQSSLQPPEGQKLQLACNYFLFQLQNSLGIRDVLMDLKSNLSANRSRFIPCISSSQYIWIIDQDRIPCLLPRDLLSAWAMWDLVASPFASYVPDGVCLLGKPGLLILLPPLQQPLAHVYSLFSLWCLTLPQVKY